MQPRTDASSFQPPHHLTKPVQAAAPAHAAAPAAMPAAPAESAAAVAPVAAPAAGLGEGLPEWPLPAGSELADATANRQRLPFDPGDVGHRSRSMTPIITGLAAIAILSALVVAGFRMRAELRDIS